jgi:hypothetical protein
MKLTSDQADQLRRVREILGGRHCAPGATGTRLNLINDLLHAACHHDNFYDPDCPVCGLQVKSNDLSLACDSFRDALDSVLQRGPAPRSSV